MEATSLANCSPEGVATFACIPIILQNVVNFLTVLATIIGGVMTLYAGITFITSGGNKEKLIKARNIFILTLLGLFLIYMVFVIVSFISNVTGVKQIAPGAPGALIQFPSF